MFHCIKNISYFTIDLTSIQSNIINSSVQKSISVFSSNMFLRFAVIFDNNIVHTFGVNLIYMMLWYSSEKENAKWISLLFYPFTSIVIHNNLLISSPIVCLKSCSVLYTVVILLGPCSLSYNLSVLSFTFLSSFFLLFLDVFISCKLQLYSINNIN